MDWLYQFGIYCLVEGKVAKVEEKIKSATVQDVEILISKIYTIQETPEQLPLLIEDASRSEKESEEWDYQVSI